MTESALIKRLLHSRRVMEKYRRYLGKQWAGPPEGELAIIETEIGILGGYQRDFPVRRDHIEGIIRGWRKAEAKIRAMMD